MTDAERKLWELLIAADNACRRHRTGVHRERVLSYRNGVMDAFALITGRDPEGVYEDLQDAAIAEHERQIAQLG